MLPEVTQALKTHLDQQQIDARTARDLQTTRDALSDFERMTPAWLKGVQTGLQQQLKPSSAQPESTSPERLELLATEAVEDQLLASRLALSIQDCASQEWSDLKRRLMFAEESTELAGNDLVRPESLARVIVEAWIQAGFSRELWKQLADQLHSLLSKQLVPVYREANRFLVSSGVMPKISLQHAVKKASLGAAGSGTGSGSGSGASGAGNGPSVQGSADSWRSSMQSQGSAYAHSMQPGGAAFTGQVESDSAGSGAEWWLRARQQTQDVFSRILRVLGQAMPEQTHSPGGQVTGQPAGQPAWPSAGQRGNAPAGSSGGNRAPVDIGYAATEPASVLGYRPSPRLQALLHESQMAELSGNTEASPSRLRANAPGQLGQAVRHLRQQSAALKQAADLPSEKATIEIVALMFQSILSEDRIQPSLRVWFARLQIPVLRVALEEPDFFSSLQHPARRLIDRMGSCALGFDASLSEASAQALEAEIKRTVQVIEQYPETGRRVFQLAFDEFQKFLTNHLQSHGQTGRLVSVAQQVEQKEALAVQYTIELRKQLNDMPVHDAIRSFLFKVWAEVLAVATVKLGAKHEMMSALRQTASDLLWAASAKPTRAERAKVIAQLPGLLVRLRKGMTLLGMEITDQEATIQQLSKILADAFMSRTESIPPAQLEALTRSLASLEDFLPQDGVEDMELDQESIELITGVDASSIEVITQGGRPPGKAMRAWAAELQLGTWFQLDHNNNPVQVQLAWRSDRGQLCLFTTAYQRHYLIQTARVASYLQAGLLVPVEGESLTVRATRAALEKLDANPERLLT